MGNCPKCNTGLDEVSIEGVTVKSGGKAWKGLNYVCPYCSCILSVAIDPVSLKADTVSEILRALGKG